MGCFNPKPVYIPQQLVGCSQAANMKDNYTILINWYRAWPSIEEYEVAYNVYYSTLRDNVFTEGPKFVSILDSNNEYPNTIIELSPGDSYFFAVKATQFDPEWMNLALLPTADNTMRVYSEGVLLSDMTEDQLTVEVSDTTSFPAFGIVQVGTELMRYTSKDNALNLLNISERGFVGTHIRFHNTDGYDGYATQDPIVRFWKGFEDNNEVIQQATVGSRYDIYNYVSSDGYAFKKDLITSNPLLSASDSDTADFPPEDQSGWHRTNPSDILNGLCVGSYYGGEIFCADGYAGINRQIRGVSLQDQASRREELLLETLGRPVVLVRRLWEGLRCFCVNPTMERGSERCPKCFATGFITGYEQFFNPRRSDGRILVRFGPADEDYFQDTAGLENTMLVDAWTLVFPGIKDYDFIIAFNSDGSEEFRYEILSVTRNYLTDNNLGAQKFKAKRVRRTDPIASWLYISDTATIPTSINTGIGLLRGSGSSFLPHSHSIVISEHITSLSQINQTTSTDLGHSHVVRAGIVEESFGHQHNLII